MRCPFCGSKRVAKLSAHMFRCATCDRYFDDDPNEGGDYDDRDPSRRLIRQEERDNTRK